MAIYSGYLFRGFVHYPAIFQDNICHFNEWERFLVQDGLACYRAIKNCNKPCFTFLFLSSCEPPNNVYKLISRTTSCQLYSNISQILLPYKIFGYYNKFDSVVSSIGRVFRPPLKGRCKMAALPLPAAILDDLISGSANEVIQDGRRKRKGRHFAPPPQ